MNRKRLTAAVLAGLAGAAGIAGTAQAVNVNPDGLGQVLLYPYYTTKGGNLTLVSVVNTTEEAKAVKVRFLEGQNSREVLDFNLYMSSYDVWVGVVADSAFFTGGEVVGIPHLQIPDTSCTVPYLYEAASTAPGLQAFLTLALDDGGDDAIGRTAEGHLEIIEMGTLLDEEVEGTFGYFVKHVEGTPRDCNKLVASWTDNTDPTQRGQWIQDWYESSSFDEGEHQGHDRFGYEDITAPSGGLFGGAAIVNVDQGQMYSYDATAINGFFDERADDGDPGDWAALHARPGLPTPNLNGGDVDTGFVFLDNGESIGYSFEDDESIDAVSYVLMHDAIMNEYVTEDAVAANTEWVITFPTKWWYVNDNEESYANPPGHTADALWNLPSGITIQPDDESLDPYSNPARPPFVGQWTDNDEDTVRDGACEPVTLDSVWDREEDVIIDPLSPPGTPIPPVVSPSDPQEFKGDPVVGFNLCFETQVIRFGTYDGATAEPPTPYAGPTEILGSDNVVNFNNDEAGFESGWARIDLYNYRIDDNGSGNPGEPDGVINEDDTPRNRLPLGNLIGLPVTGFAVQSFRNDFADSGTVRAYYGGIFRHKGTRQSYYDDCCLSD